MHVNDTLAPLPQQEGVEFRHIPGCYGYAVTDTGEVWSCRRDRSGNRVAWWKRLKANTDKGGYLRVWLRVEINESSEQLVHRLVLKAFKGECPHGFEGRHLDGDKQNNHPSNLAWGTAKENSDDKRRHGTQPKGMKIAFSKLTDDQVREIRDSYVPFSRSHGSRALGRRFNVVHATVSRIVNGTGWTHLLRQTAG